MFGTVATSCDLKLQENMRDRQAWRDAHCRRAICCLQRLWRIQFQKRQVAVIRVQRMARGWLARQRFCTMYLGMVHIQV